jgi:hypothetical protein
VSAIPRGFHAEQWQHALDSKGIVAGPDRQKTVEKSEEIEKNLPPSTPCDFDAHLIIMHHPIK